MRGAGTGYSKYKIGESFRKLVGKLRSASSERKKARGGSTSQLTQTDDNDGPTYLQYNVIDRNIPLVSERDASEERRPPERPPRNAGSSSKVAAKAVRQADHVVQEQSQRSASTPPLQRYYLGEDPFGGSIYGREKGYENDGDRRRGRSRGKIAVDSEHR